MKSLYISEMLRQGATGNIVEVCGWVASKRRTKNNVFIDIVDSTGRIQAIIDTRSHGHLPLDTITPESSIKVTGTLQRGSRNLPELQVSSFQILAPADLVLSPRPRRQFDIFNPHFVPHLLRNRHIYLRNERLTAVLKFRHKLIQTARDWFHSQDFTEVHGPILTQLQLYDDESGLFRLGFFGSEVYLTQCVAFYLEAAVDALERVYCINPSFRAEKSRGPRHLAEYWHLKAEVAFADVGDIIRMVESMFGYILERLPQAAEPELRSLGSFERVQNIPRPPYPRITYDEALITLSNLGVRKAYGTSLSASDEAKLCAGPHSMLWVTGLPRAVEPFPYALDEANASVTKTADLIASDGFGEILGAAEKIWHVDKLLERMAERGRKEDPRYQWYAELRRAGTAPHSGFGMGIERTIRWLLGLRHVRDAIPFPRLFRRCPNP